MKASRTTVRKSKPTTKKSTARKSPNRYRAGVKASRWYHPDGFIAIARSPKQLFAAVAVVGVALAGMHFTLNSLAATGPQLANIEAESLTLPGGANVKTDTTVSGGRYLYMAKNGTASGSSTFASPAVLMKLRAKGTACNGSPVVNVLVDGQLVISATLTSSWADYTSGVNLSAAPHTVAVKFANDYSKGKCNRDVSVDNVVFYAAEVVTPPPTPSPTPTPPPPATTSCLPTSTSTIQATAANGFVNDPDWTLASIYNNRDLVAGTGIDANGTNWIYSLINDADASQIYGVRIRGGDNVCWSGGRFVGTNSDSAHPIWETWHDLNGFRLGGMKNFVFENLYVRNFGDLLNISDDNGKLSDNWAVRDTLLRHSHDDCIQNDKMAAGKVSNSFFDGCYTAFSARMSDSDLGASIINGVGKTFEVENSLIWLEPMTPVYKGQLPGHGNFLKWETGDPAKGMNLSLRNVTLMARQSEDDEVSNNAGSKLTTCENVTIVWLGTTAFPGTGWPAGCVTVLTGQAGKDFWLQKVNEWYAAHPQFQDLKQADDYYFTYTQQ